MEPYFVSLFGHRDILEHRKIEQRLTKILRELASTKEFVEIYIGRNGEFDVFAASVVKRETKKDGYGNVGMTLVLPYGNKNEEYYETYYDGLIIPECVEGAHPKGAIKKRNQWMVERSDLVICFCERETGGAYYAMKYADSLGKKTINLAKEDNLF